MTQSAIIFQQQSDDSRGCLGASVLSRTLIEERESALCA
jgi:hypothetical protein